MAGALRPALCRGGGGGPRRRRAAYSSRLRAGLRRLSLRTRGARASGAGIAMSGTTRARDILDVHPLDLLLVRRHDLVREKPRQQRRGRARATSKVSRYSAGLQPEACALISETDTREDGALSTNCHCATASAWPVAMTPLRQSGEMCSPVTFLILLAPLLVRGAPPLALKMIWLLSHWCAYGCCRCVPKQLLWSGHLP